MRLIQLVSLIIIMSVCCNCTFVSSNTENVSEETNPQMPPSSATALTSPIAEDVTVIFAAQKISRQLYEPLAKKFTAENPRIHIQFTTLDDPSDVSQAVRIADTALVYFDSVSDRRQLVQANQILNLQPFIDSDASFDRADFTSNVLETATVGDGLYMIPRMIGISLLAYNKDLWQQRGLPSPKADMSWDDILDAASELAQVNGNKGEPYGLLDSSHYVEAFARELQNSGTNLFTTSLSQLQLNSPNSIAALSRISSLIQSRALYVPGLNKNMLNNNAIGEELREQINEQRIGIWNYMFDQPYDPSPSFPVGFLPPMFPYQGSPEGYIISGGTLKQDAAWRWISFLSQNEPAAFYETNLSNVPARTSFAKRLGYWEKLSSEDAAVIRATFAYPPVGMSVSDGIVVDHSDILINMVNAVVSGKRSARQAAADAQAAIEQVLSATTPVPTPTPPGPVIVATPVPEVVQPKATPIRFAALGLGADQLAPLVQQFTKQHPEIAVHLQTPTSGGTIAALARNTDCFVSFQLPQAGEETALLDLQPLADADASFPRTDFLPAVLARFHRGGKLLGLPLALGLPALHANPIVLDQAGVSAADATSSLDSFRDAAQRASRGRDANRTYGFAVSDGVYGLNTWLEHTGVLPVVERNGMLSPQFTTPELRAAVQAYLDLLRSSSPHTHITGYTREPLADEGAAPRSQNRVAFWLDAAERYGGTSAVTDTGTLLPLPTSEQALPSFTVVAAGYISAQSTQPQACWQWLRFLSDTPQLLVNTYPVRPSQANTLPAAQQAVYAAAQKALARTDSLTVDVFDDSRIDLFWFYRAVDRALGGKNLERELADAQTLTEQYLACISGGTSGEPCATQVDPAYAGLQKTTP